MKLNLFFMVPIQKVGNLEQVQCYLTTEIEGQVEGYHNKLRSPFVGAYIH